MDNDKSGPGGSGTATPYEQHLDLVAREKAVAEREARAAERVEKAQAAADERLDKTLAWARELYGAVARREERVALREAEVFRRETEVARHEHGVERAPLGATVDGFVLNADTAPPGTRPAGHLERTRRATPPMDALGALADTLCERLFHIERSISGTPPGPSPSFTVERHVEPWHSGMVLCTVHWQPPRQSPPVVRIDQGRTFLEVGPVRWQFIEIKPLAPEPDGTVLFELDGKRLDADGAVEKSLQHLFGAHYEAWVGGRSRRQETPRSHRR